VSANIADHVAVSTQDRNVEWLKQALQIAIELEHATLPIYLAAMYSLWVQNYTTYNLVRSIAMEEMVHMAIACNILAALGGSPRIKDLAPKFPSHGLPGGAEPDLYVGLAKVSPPQLKNFLRIEMPTTLLPAEFKTGTYPTISKLYDAIREAIEANADEVRAAIKHSITQGGPPNQIGDDIGFTTITYKENEDPLPQLYSAIDAILVEGEGSSADSLLADASEEGEESHYGKFAEIYYGRRYQPPVPPIPLTRETEPQFFQGYRLLAPKVTNTLFVPSDGYQRALKLDPNGAAVEQSLLAFDQVYSGIMSNLDAMWNGPPQTSWPTFGQAVGAMGDLRVKACFGVMVNQVPPGVVERLGELYPDEFDLISLYTDLDQPVFYGPRFRNLNAASAATS
jgi:Ferritin-like